MAEQTVQEQKVHTVLVLATGTDNEGQEYRVPYRIFRRHWKKLGGLKDTQEGERNFVAWLRKRDKRKGADLKITFLRYEDMAQGQIAEEPEV